MNILTIICIEYLSTYFSKLNDNVSAVHTQCCNSINNQANTTAFNIFLYPFDIRSRLRQAAMINDQS